MSCLTKRIPYLNGPGVLAVKTIDDDDIDWMRKSRSLLDENFIKSGEVSVLHYLLLKPFYGEKIRFRSQFCM